MRFSPSWRIPPEDGRPPFLMVLDVAFVLEVYADFAQSGIYTPFPNPREHRIYLKDLDNPDILERLYLIWTDPLLLNPALATERATNDIADLLARLAASLEQSRGRLQVHDALHPEHVRRRWLSLPGTGEPRVYGKDSQYGRPY